MPLNSQQQAAVEYLDGPLLVLAGPGTGKTQLLSKKVEYILQNTDTDPSMILCITYTEAGARNMKERLRSMIGQSADNIDIMTFHSFGQKILSRYNNYSDKPHRTYSDPIDEMTQIKIIEEIKANLPPTYLLKNEKNPHSLINAIAKIKISNLNHHDLQKIITKNEADIALLNQELSKILQNLPARASGKKAFFQLFESVYQPLLYKLGELKNNQPIVQNIYSIADTLYEQLFSLVSDQQAVESPSVANINKFIRKHFTKTSSGEYKLNINAAHKRLQELATLFEQYQLFLTNNDLYDFNDMIEMSIHYLEQDDNFRRSIAQEYLYLMVDEYQDTNPSQTKLIELIADEQERPSIMAVGDDDQSIFEFQGAKASSLIHFQNHFNAKVIILTDNYRSTAEILHFSRKIADQLEESFIKNTAMQQSLHTNDQTIATFKKELNSINNTKILQPGNDDQLFEQIFYSNSEIADKASSEQKNDTKSALRTFISRHEFLNLDLEYYWVAQKVHELVQAGENPSSIGILFPKHDMVAPLLPYLRSYPEIKIAYERTENILENQQIHEILVLCRFIYELSEGENPIHRLPEILSFDFWNINSRDIILAINSNSHTKKTVVEILESYQDNPLFILLASFFSELTKQSFSLPLEVFLDILIGRTPIDLEVNHDIKSFTSPFLSYYAHDLHSIKTYNLYNRLSLLREHLASHSHQEKLRLINLIQILDDYEQTKTTITERTFYEDSKESIQLMTAHKSKGLEFKHVFLIGVNKAGWDSSYNASSFSLPLNLEILQDAKNTADGKKRLFFVAITRTAKTLTLTNSRFNSLSDKPNDRLSFLNEKIDDSNHLISPLIPSNQVILHDQPLQPQDKASSIYRHWINKLLNPEEDIRQLLLNRANSLRMSASHLSSFIRLTYAGPLKFYEQAILCAPKEPPSVRLIYGILIHKVFEEITKNHLSTTDAITLFDTELKKQDLLPKDLETLSMLGKNDLPLAITAFEHILKADGAKAEVDFSNELLEFDGIPLTGKIDHLNIDEKNKVIDLYDFKTSSISDKDSWQTKENLYIYQFQLLFYRLLLQKSKKYKNYTVRSMNLLFTAPNRLENTEYPEGKIHHLELTEEDIAKNSVNFENLLRAVYQQIKNLGFLDPTSSLINYYDNDNAKLQDIKNFCVALVEDYKNKK